MLSYKTAAGTKTGEQAVYDHQEDQAFEPAAHYKKSIPRRIIRSKAGKIAAGATGVAVIAAGLSAKLEGKQIVKPGESKVEAEVVKLEPMALDCRARMETKVGVTVRTKYDAALVGELPGSGFVAHQRDSSGDKGTKATYDTLTCLDGKTTTIDVDMKTKKQTVNIDMAGMQLFSRRDAEKSRTVIESPLLSIQGEVLSKLGNIVTFGTFDASESAIAQMKGDTGSLSEQVAENTVEANCANAILPLTKKVVEISYRNQAVEKGISPTDVTINWLGEDPVFEGPYALDGKNGSFEAHIEQFETEECVVDGDVMTQVNDAYIMQVPEPSLVRAAE